MAHLRVGQTVDDFAVQYRAATDTSPDRQIETVRDRAAGAPTGLPENGGIHIGIESDWNADFTRKRVREIVIAPFQLRRRRDASALQIYGAKRRNADGSQIAARVVAQPRDGRSNRLGGR